MIGCWAGFLFGTEIGEHQLKKNTLYESTCVVANSEVSNTKIYHAPQKTILTIVHYKSSDLVL